MGGETNLAILLRITTDSEKVKRSTSSFLEKRSLHQYKVHTALSKTCNLLKRDFGSALRYRYGYIRKSLAPTNKKIFLQEKAVKAAKEKEENRKKTLARGTGRHATAINISHK
jgi:hypothetical protein